MNHGPFCRSAELVAGVHWAKGTYAGFRAAHAYPTELPIFRDALPQSELHLINSVHFAWEDADDEYAELVQAWTGYKACAKAISVAVL